MVHLHSALDPRIAPSPRVRVMGVVNVTPDSFSDGGRFARPEAAIAEARAMEAAGADMIDIGGESTRPGHTPVDAETELSRVLPVLDGLRDTLSIPVSIDTTKAEIARAAIARGASIVNDVWGLRKDPALAPVCAEAGVETVVMHNREAADAGIDILDDIERFFEGSLEIARAAGIREERIVLDPGIGFGKTYEQNLVILRHLGRLKTLGFPLLVGASRKSFLGRILDVPAPERLVGSLAAHLHAALSGADIVRVHDVAEHVAALKVVHAIGSA